MGTLIRVLFPLLGYFCVATVITIAAGYGYLRQTGKLNDENMFRVVSLLHGVDLEEIAAANKTDQEDVPPEEMSFEQRQQHLLMTTLHLQAKKDDIEKNIAEFQAQASRLDTQFNRVKGLSEEVEGYLQRRKDEAMESGLVGVREQWKNLNAKKQTKQLLIKMIKEGRMNLVILLLNGMPPKNRTEILKTMDTDEDVNMLYRIEKQMLKGHPESTYIDEKMKQLDRGEN